MAIVHAQTKAATTQGVSTTTTITETFTSSVSSGNFIAVGMTIFLSGGTAPNLTSISDNFGNTYTQARNNLNGDRRTMIYYAYNVTGGASLAVTAVFDATATAINMALSEYSGVLTSDPLEITGVSSGTSTTPSITLVPTWSNSLYVGVMIPYMSGGITITPNDNGRSTKTDVQQHSQQDLMGVSGSQTLDWTLGSSNFWQTTGATFKSAADSSSSSSCRSSSSSSSSCRSSSSSCRSSSSSSSSCRSSSSSSSSSLSSISSSSSSCRSSSSSSSCSSSSSSSCRSSSSSSSSFSVTSATGYYFNYTSGSNTTGAGTLGNPWKFFNGKADGVGFLVPGDHCYFNRGDVWVGTDAEVVVNSSGTVSSPIVLTYYGSGTNPPIFASAGITTAGWAVHTGSIYRILGQTQTNLFTVTQDDNKALGAWRGTNSTLPAGTFKRESSTLYVHLWSSSNPATSSVRIGNFATASSGGLGLVRAGSTTGSFVEFDGIKVLGANGIGMEAYQTGCEINNCVVTGSGKDGIVFAGLTAAGWNATDWRIYNTEISYNAASGVSSGQGVTISSGSTTTEGAIYSCNVHDNFMAGIDVLRFPGTPTPQRIAIAFNTVKDNGRWQDATNSFDPGIYVDGGINIFIYGNLVSGNGTTTGTIPAHSGGILWGTEYADSPNNYVCQNIDIINNLVYSIHWIGLASSNAASTAASILNCSIINNTVLAWLAGTADQCWLFEDVSTTANNFVMRNNIFVTSGGNNRISLFADAGAYLDADYNLYYQTTGSSTIYTSGGTDYTLATWRTLSGEDANSINANPLLVSTSDTSPDVHILAGSSPAIDAGVASPFTVASWVTGLSDYTTIFPNGAEVYGYATTDGVLDDTSVTIDIGYHYPTTTTSSSSSSSSSSCRSSSSSSCCSSSSSSSSSCRSSSSSSSSCCSSSSCSSSSSSSINNSSSSSSSSCRSSSSSSSSSSCRSSSSCSSSSSSSCKSSSSSCSSSSCRSSSSSCRSSSSSSSSVSQTMIIVGDVVKVSSEITYLRST